MTPFVQRALEILAQREAATTTEGKREAEDALAKLIQQQHASRRQDGPR
jgi:hypothetical protein